MIDQTEKRPEQQIVFEGLQTSDWFDVDKFKLSEDDKLIIYEIPVTFSINFSESRIKLLLIFKDVELKMERDSYVFWVKCYKK